MIDELDEASSLQAFHELSNEFMTLLFGPQDPLTVIYGLNRLHFARNSKRKILNDKPFTLRYGRDLKTVDVSNI